MKALSVFLIACKLLTLSLLAQEQTEINSHWTAYCSAPLTDLPIPPQLPQSEIARQFSLAEEGFTSRWDFFAQQHAYASPLTCL
jgi:hypothetical protein